MKRFRFVSYCLLFAWASSSFAASLEFTLVPSGANVAINAATATSSGTFCAVGGGASALLPGSPLTNTWSANKVSASGESLTAITYGNGEFVAGDADGNIYTSPDGATWASQGNVLPSSAIGGLAYNNGTFVATGKAPLASMAYAKQNNLAASKWTGVTQYSPVAPSSIEVYGVAPLGPNGFIACGNDSQIYINSNAGVSWTHTAHGPATTANIFFGIAQGGSTYVAVGTRGMIVVSQNNGVTWTTSSPGIKTNLNAVAYDGTEFIAVGDGGVILTSTTSGTSWVTNASPTKQNLLGVASAASGADGGVTVIVGAQATIILAAAPPEAPTTTVTVSTCTNIASLSATNASSASQTVDWYYTNQTTLLASGTNSYTPSFLATNAYINNSSNYTFYIQARDTRTEMTSALVPVTVTVFPTPTATVVSGTTSICDSNSTILSVALTGIAPFQVTWSAGAQTIVSNYETTTGTLPVSPHSTSPDLASTNVYQITSLSDSGNGCSSVVSGSHTVIAYPIPTATVASGTTSICDSNSTIVSVALTGIAPFQVTWSAGGQTIVSNYGTTTGTLPVSPHSANPNLASTNVYQITSLSDSGNGCSSVVSGSHTVIAYPIPTATVASGTTSICDSNSTIVSVALTGIAPFQVTWSAGGQTIVSNYGTTTGTLPVSPHSANPNLASTNVYQITSLTDSGNGCTNIISGSYTVIAYPIPTATVTSGTTNICDNESVTLSVALTGIAPFHVTWEDNVVSNYTTTSGTRTVSPHSTNPNLQSTNAYSVTSLTDSGNGCANTPTGSYTVIAYPIPGATLAASSLSIYSGETVSNSVTLAGVGLLTADWEGSDGSSGMVVTNAGVGYFLVTPTNTSTGAPTIPLTNYYTITTISGTNACDGTGTTTNTVLVYELPPLSISQSGTNVTVSWFAPAPINLQNGADLGPEGLWQTVTNSITGQNNSVSIPVSTNAATFYRLSTSP